MTAIDKIRFYFFGFSELSRSIISDLDNWEEIIKSFPKSLNSNQLTSLGKTIYEAKLKKSIADLYLTKSEKVSLEKIVAYFSLKGPDVRIIKKKFGKTAVKRLVEDCYKDKVLTDDEKDEIFDFASYLGLAYDETESIRKSVALNLLYTAMNTAVADKRLSPDEEKELGQVLKNLQLPDNLQAAGMSTRSIQQLALFKLLWQMEQGVFTPIQSPLNLKKSEECYLHFPAKLLEQKTITTHHRGISSGVSIRIAKGVHYRVGSSRSFPIKQTFTVEHSGNLFLTNQRIVFSSTKGFVLPHDKLITFDVFQDGIGFEATKTFLLRFDPEQVEVFATGLSSILRKRFES